MEEEPSAFEDRAGAAGEKPPRHSVFLSRGVASVGLASFFSDAGHEITTSILPSFVTGVLRGSAGALGLIEGISDAVLGLATLVGGMLSNDERRRLALARSGYLSMAAATGAIGLSAALWQVAILRAASWFARGLRSPARDSMLTSLAPREAYGRAFGIERAGDNLGAVVGPLAAAGLVAWLGVRPTLYLAAVPTVFAALAISIAASEARKLGVQVRRRVSLELRGLREAGLAAPMLPIAMFELANVSSTLLILRSTDLLHHGGRTLAAATSLAVLVYAGHNAFAAVVALAGGRWIDRVGPRMVFATGAALYVPAYAAFALPLRTWPALLAASHSQEAASDWPRRPSLRWLHGCCQTASAVAASASLAACSHSEDSHPLPSSACSGRQFLRRSGSCTPRAGCCSPSQQRRACGIWRHEARSAALGCAEAPAFAATNAGR